jgi:hypothetical protein
MSKHTPGPWDASRWRVCAEPGGNIKVICDTANNKASRTEENAANARLIAAAPDLLAACRSLLAQLEFECGDLVSEAKAAIAKAEGSD